MAQGTIEPKQGVTLTRAADGDLMVIMDGADMADGAPVELRLSGGTFEVNQSGTCHARMPAGDEAALLADLRGAGALRVMEVYPAPDEDDVRLVVHSDVHLVLHGGAAVHPSATTTADAG